MSLSIDKLKELSAKIASDPDSVYDLAPAEAIEVRKFMNPLGGVVTAKKTYVNLSIINWKEKYMRRIHMTALIGYLYRTLEEHQPEEIERENRNHARATDYMVGRHGVEYRDSPEYKDAENAHAARVKLLKSTAHGIIKKFLDSNFEHNPDIHLRGSHTDNSDDPERQPVDDAIRAACSTASTASEIDAKLESRPDATYQYLREHLLATYQAAIQASNTIKATLSVIIDPAIKTDDKQGLLFKKYKQLLDTCEDMKKIAEPLASADTLSAWKVNPPADVFHQFDRYLTNHYEQVREVCAALYNEKPDFEYAVILYDAFKTPEAAREYRIQHENEFRTEVLTVENSAVTLLGPFVENRQRIDFFNKNTEVMKRMMDQLESDHKLGKDLMEKQVRAKKKKNIEEAGPDHPALAAYAKTMNRVQELGAKKILTREEQESLAAAKVAADLIREDYEIPDDTVQVDMFFPRTESDGTTTLTKTKFFTQAEAPLHMQEGSQFNEQYQPLRSGESVDTAYKTKTITGKSGQKLEIKVPAFSN